MSDLLHINVHYVFNLNTDNYHVFRLKTAGIQLPGGWMITNKYPIF